MKNKTIVIYIILAWFKRTQAGFVLTGIIIVAGFYLVARQFNLVLTASLFEKFFAVILITLIVIFQEDLKHFFEQIAIWSLNRRFPKKQKVSLIARPEVDILIRTVMDLAREKIGALIVLRGKDTIIRHLDGGEELGGTVSEPLLKSIFDPHSIGHDGAVIVEGNKITKFSCHLPLSKNLKKVKDHGTRHAAALGITELTDALCLVVSEEKGTISITHNGDINKFQDPDKLKAFLEDFYQEVNPKQKSKPWQDFFRRNIREKVYALMLSIALWFVFVYGAKEIYRSYKIPVSYEEKYLTWTVSTVEPNTIDITLRGQRKAFYFISNGQIKLTLKIMNERNQQIIKVRPEHILLPKGTELENFSPKEINVSMEKNK